MSLGSMLGELVTTSAREHVRKHEATKKMNDKIIDDTTRRVIDALNKHLPVFLRNQASEGLMSAKIYVKFECCADKPEGPRQTFPLGRKSFDETTLHITERLYDGKTLAPEDVRFNLPRDKALKMVWGASYPQTIGEHLKRVFTDHFSGSCKDWPPTIGFDHNPRIEGRFEMVFRFDWGEAAWKRVREMKSDLENRASKKAKVQTVAGKNVQVKVESDQV